MNFYDEVYNLVRKIPPGKVATYGQVAAVISTPRAARVVGFALRALGPKTNVPWQRVINTQGMISIENMFFSPQEQARLLRKEGVGVNERDGNYFVDLTKYLYILPKSR